MIVIKKRYTTNSVMCFIVTDTLSNMCIVTDREQIVYEEIVQCECYVESDACTSKLCNVYYWHWQIEQNVLRDYKQVTV